MSNRSSEKSSPEKMAGVASVGERPRISVIIPHLDQPDALKLCLASLIETEGSPRFEVIVVDNGSRLLPIETCARFDARLIVQPTPGPGPARNLGAAHARGEILAFIDADCVAGAGWLADIDGCFRDNPQTPIVGGDVRIGMVDPARPSWLEAYESVFAYRMKEYIARQGFTGTGNLAVWARVFKAVGPFGGIEIAEDRDWGQRALRLGYRTHYRSSMIVYHPARKSFDEIATKWRRHVAHDFQAMRARRAWWPRWMLRTAAVAASPAAEIVRIAFSRRISGLRTRALAFGGVVTVRAYRAGLMLSLGLGATGPRGAAAQWNRGELPG